MIEEEVQDGSSSIVRPEDMIPFVREYLGLLDEKNMMDAELKRCFNEYKIQRDKLLNKRKPIDEHLERVEEILKKAIMGQKLPGVKYKQYIITLEEKPVYKPQAEKIIEVLETNPIEHFTHDKQALARIIADAIKKKIRDTSDKMKKDIKTLGIKIRTI